MQHVELKGQSQLREFKQAALPFMQSKFSWSGALVLTRLGSTTGFGLPEVTVMQEEVTALP